MGVFLPEQYMFLPATHVNQSKLKVKVEISQESSVFTDGNNNNHPCSNILAYVCVYIYIYIYRDIVIFIDE